MARVLVVGGGASGMVSAIYASRNGNEVIICDKNNNLGKKILLTGNGKCNYWNSDISLEHYNSLDKDVLEKIITDENKLEIENFFDRLGIVPKIRGNYFYPSSNQATSIQTALILECELNGVKILNNEEVLSIKKIENSFEVKTNNMVMIVDKVIISTGSSACPKTGSDGMGYHFAKSLGHKVIKPLPALVQLKVNASYLKEWAGIRCDVLVSLYENNKLIKQEEGEIQLTSDGISGICVFQLSSLVSRGLYNSYKEEIEINFLNGLGINNEDIFISFMNERNNKVLNRDVSQLLDGILNYKLINLILKISKINRDDFWNEISYEKKRILGNYLTKFRINIVETNSFDSAQVCSGGVSLREINPNTMESLIVPGLYFTGEVLDVDGECGGFNLGFAWISGYLAGNSIGGDVSD